MVVSIRGLVALLRNRTFILLSALAGGLLLSGPASRMSGLTLPALAVVLTVSVTQVSPRDFVPLRRVVRPVVSALLLNFVLHGALVLVLARWLMPTRELFIGYVLVAAAPPGIAVVPFTHVMRGDLRLSVHGTFGLYAVCLLLTPALIYLLTGGAVTSPLQLFRTILLLILIPFAVAQAIRPSRAAPYIDRWRGTIINWGFFVVVFTVVGLNREVFLSQPRVLALVSAPALLSSFGLAALVEAVGRRLNLGRATVNSAVLLASIKNSAFAAAIGLSLFGEASSVPGAVLGAWYALYFIYLGIKGERAAGAGTPPTT